MMEDIIKGISRQTHFEPFTDVGSEDKREMDVLFLAFFWCFSVLLSGVCRDYNTFKAEYSFFFWVFFSVANSVSFN